MAEIELSVLTSQCLDRRIDSIEVVQREVKAWEESRNNKDSRINWQFTTEDARVKLSRLYPTFED
jgi:predicted AAA+ superfamily ATPase